MKSNVFYSFLLIVFFGFLKGCAPSTVSDIEGNNYQTVKIGDQIWMAENLKVTKLNDGTEIPMITDRKEWEDAKSPAYCWLNNDEINKNKFGALYNWETVNTKKLCPSGWHVPDFKEVQLLSETVRGTAWPGPVLRSKEYSGGEDKFGFNGEKSGYRVHSIHGDFQDNEGRWWIGGEASNERNAWMYYIRASQNNDGFVNEDPKSYGYSIRCVKD